MMRDFLLRTSPRKVVGNRAELRNATLDIMGERVCGDYTRYLFSAEPDAPDSGFVRLRTAEKRLPSALTEVAQELPPVPLEQGAKVRLSVLLGFKSSRMNRNQYEHRHDTDAKVFARLESYGLGISLSEAFCDDWGIVTVTKGRDRFAKRWERLRATGVITDPQALEHRMLRGVGHSIAYGFGLIVVTPIEIGAAA